MATSRRRPEWLAPSAAGDEDGKHRLGWLVEQDNQALAYLKGMRAYYDIDLAQDIIAGEEGEEIAEGLSDAYSNRQKRGASEIISTAADFRHFVGYKCRVPEYQHTSDVLNKLSNSWWNRTRADRKLKEGLQWSTIAGTGWVSPLWELELGRHGEGEIQLYTYGPRDVRPVQVPRDHDIQKAYMVTICAETPIHLARMLFPLHAHLIQPDRDSPTWAKRGMSWLSRNIPFVQNLFGGEKETAKVGFPTVDIRYSYIMDGAVNETGRPVHMGQLGSSWAYTVPYKGQPIPTNMFNPDGSPVIREANWEDIRLFPYRRLITWAKSGILGDDTSPYWHGKVPAVRMTHDKWPWEFLGFSILRDGYPLQKSFNRLMRAIDDSANGRLRASMGYQDNITAETMKRLDPRIGGRHIPVDYTMGDPIRPLLPFEYYNLPPYIIQMLEFYREEMDYLMANRDMAAIAKANQIPSDQTIEKLMELAGPKVKDMGRDLEGSVVQLGELQKFNFFQFYTARKRYALYGKDGLVKEDFDFNPGTMTPSHFPWERANIDSRASEMERRRWYAQQFSFEPEPNTMFNITQLTKKMGVMQLWRIGFPIDPWTVAEAWGLENFGEPPSKASTVIDRWKAWLMDSSQFTASLQAMAALRASMMAGQLPAEAGGGKPNGSGEGQGQPQRGPGRPPTAQTSPRFESKDQGNRTTVAESPR